MAEITRDQIYQTLLNMLVYPDWVELISHPSKRSLGVKAAPAAVVMVAAPRSSSSRKRRTLFINELKEAGANKINVIKVVRELFGLASKKPDLVEAVAKAVKEGAFPRLTTSKKKLEDAGSEGRAQASARSFLPFTFFESGLRGRAAVNASTAPPPRRRSSRFSSLLLSQPSPSGVPMANVIQSNFRIRVRILVRSLRPEAPRT
jgi:large subunit ribosomal protein L7/L12